MKSNSGATLALTLTLAAATSAHAQSQQITRAETRNGSIGSEATFTGTAYVAPVFDPKMADVSAGEVTFLPGARSAWHTHPGGQMLVVTKGVGWVQERGRQKEVIRAGDVVWCPPGVEHWHGATLGTAVTHYAIQAVVDGSAVDWGEKVSEQDYGQ